MSDPSGNSGNTCEGGSTFKFPDGYKPGEFLYGDQGPWPSKPNGNPCAMAPEVLATSIPAHENDDWSNHLEHYYWTNYPEFSIDAAEYAVTITGVSKPDSWSSTKLIEWMWYRDDLESYPKLDDDLFRELIAHGLLSKLLCELDEPDNELFEKYLRDDTREYWKNDATHMRAVLKPDESEYLAPAIVLLSRPKNPSPGQEFDFEVHAIALYGQVKPGDPYNLKADIYAPGDGKAWQLAKYFALQGAFIRINLIDHPMVHFPSDTINAITKTALPKSNLVLQLLAPHFRLSLPVDNSVLEGQFSLINRVHEYPYSPYPAKGEEIRKVFPFYWEGSDFYLNDDRFWMDRKKAFPKFRFPLEPNDIPSRYGKFMNAFYWPILDFTRKVVNCIPDDNKSHDWAEIRSWADYVSGWIPGFPNGGLMTQNPDILAKALAYIIWNAAIVHSLNHYLMHDMFERRYPVPYIIRDEPPMKSGSNNSNESDYQAKTLLKDFSAARLCDLLFFMPHNTVTLFECVSNFEKDKPCTKNTKNNDYFDCTYGFDKNNSSLVNAVKEFKDDLSTTFELMRKKYPEFSIKLEGNDGENDHMCYGAGVQY